MKNLITHENTIALPYFDKLDADEPKVLIADNLSSHISNDVIRMCNEKKMRFVLLPLNSTNLTQPLDVAVFRSLKTGWRSTLTEWKMKNRGTIPKEQFPRLLRQCLDQMM